MQEAMFTRLLEAERRAQAISLEAVQQQQGLEEELREAVAALEACYAAETEKQQQAQQQQIEARNAQALEALNAQHQHRLQQMESIYAAEKDNWVQTIFSRIISA